MWWDSPGTPASAAPWWALPLGSIIAAILGSMGLKMGSSKPTEEVVPEERRRTEERFKKIEDTQEKHHKVLEAHTNSIEGLSDIKKDFKEVRDWKLRNEGNFKKE